MLGRSRIGLVAALVVALVALAASPAYASSKKAGTITSGSSVVLLNTSGLVKVTLTCHNSDVGFSLFLGTDKLDIWVERTGAALQHVNSVGNTIGSGIPKPAHIEWSVSRATKVALGEVYVAAASGNSNDCVYTSQIS